MIGAQVFSAANVGNVGGTWSVAGTADFNGDGKGDILWRDGSGNTAVWLMNRASVLSSGSLGNIPTTWSVAGTGDFNGNGDADILWRDSSRNTSIWFMSGTTVSSSGVVQRTGAAPGRSRGKSVSSRGLSVCGGVSVDPLDAGKLIKGKRRHILVDTPGLLLHAIVHSAGVQDRE
jgi:hypothetical protein